jgi:DNA-binding beta-propeller fold protein YncE
MKTNPSAGWWFLALAFCTLVRAAEPVPRSFAVVALPNPRAVAVDPAGNLYVGDVATPKVYRITPAGQVTVLGAGGPVIADPIGLAVGRDGTVYVSDADANTIYQILPDDRVVSWAKPSPVPADTALSAPTSIVLDGAGNALVTNNSGNAVLTLSPTGAATVLAGKRGEAGSAEGPGAAARFGRPRGIAIDAQGNLYVADEQNSNIRRITPMGAVTTLAGTAGTAGSTDGSGTTARFGAPRAVAADIAGNVYVADTDNHVIRKINPAGMVTTLAGRAGERGKADGRADAARFSEPRSIAVDAAGTIYVADTGNGTIRQITPDGVVSTIAGATKP